MIQQHIILAFLWILFSAFHSLFATEAWKKQVQAVMRTHYKFYRMCYSMFALITLTVVAVYNFRLQSFLMWNAGIIEQFFSIAGMLLFGFIMLKFTKRFFFDLSGADVFRKQAISRQLIRTDLYKYVRHPLYSATLGFIWSIFFYHPLLSNLISCVCITVYTVIGIYFEEKKLVIEFGENYLSYRSKTPMLIPRFSFKKYSTIIL